MKKKTINQKDFILLSAHSRSNGIVFESKECPFLQVDTFVDTKGNIQSIIVPNEIGAIHELVEFKNTYLKKESNKLFLILTVIFDLAMFIFLTAVFRNLSISSSVPAVQ